MLKNIIFVFLIVIITGTITFFITASYYTKSSNQTSNNLSKFSLPSSSSVALEPCEKPILQRERSIIIQNLKMVITKQLLQMKK